MGGGDNMSNTTTKTEQKKNHLHRVKCSKLPITIGDIKKAIPPHCFQRSLLRSLFYLARDVIFVCIFYYIAITYFRVLPSPYYYYYLAWSIYWIVQGCVCTGIWVIAHECGHHAFSHYPWLNDTVGFILHSVLLTPYFSWKYSHRRHHSNTNSLEHDENHVPKLKSQLRWCDCNCLRVVSHYFSTRTSLVVCIYGVPLLIVNGFILLITFLHHTHPSLPHYDIFEWDWLR
ncbi:hypothetical protein RDI58_028762 [Solanum bulbocastanum]|uniref:Fatty acid desaturase domain-containing protein n=1 Tax=Solanum bulbocastanum TaxID=147425 RepID=A0AAN8SSH7_SOLBU